MSMNAENSMNSAMQTEAEHKSTLHYEAEYGERISRLFIFRPLWMIVEMWVIWAWAIWMAIIIFVDFWYKLILGRRSKALFDKRHRFCRHVAKWQAYLNHLIDERPKFIED